MLEMVSADSVSTDTRDKRAEYAAAGLPRYWIVRMARNDGPAVSVERFRLSAGGASECASCSHVCIAPGTCRAT